MVGATLIFITSGRNQHIGGIGDQLHHARLIAEQGADLWSRVLVLYGTVPTRLAIGALAVRGGGRRRSWRCLLPRHERRA